MTQLQCGAWNLRVGKVPPRRVRRLLRKQKLDVLCTSETHPRAPQLRTKLAASQWRVHIADPADPSARDSTIITRRQLAVGPGHVLRLEKKGWERKPGRPGLHWPRSAYTIRVVGIQYVAVHLPPGPFGAKYPLRKKANLTSLETLTTQALLWNKANVPWVMAGDWNRQPSDPEVKAFAKATGCLVTGRGIDWVAHRGCKVTGYRKLSFRGSDHKPIVFTVSM